MCTDIKVINILINSKRDLGDFVSSLSENIFDKKYRSFIRCITNYYRLYCSCPTLPTLLEFYNNKEHEFKCYLEEI